MSAPGTTAAPIVTAGRPSTRDRLVALAVLVAALLVYVPTAAYHQIHIDVEAATAESWHIAATGDPDLTGDLTAKMATNKFFGETADGRVVGMRMAGPVLAALPFYWVAGADTDHFGYGPGAVAAAAVTAVTVLLLFLALRRRLPERTALVATAVVALGTPTWSVSANMMWTHTVTQLGLAGAAWALGRGRWWWAGLFLGVGMLGRPHIALVAALLGLGLLWSRRSLRPAIGLAVPTVVTLGALAVWNHWMFGIWSVGGAYAGKGAAAAEGFSGSEEWHGRFPQLVNVAGFLFSPDKGLLVWTPLLLVLLPAVVRAWRQVPDWSRWLAVGGVLYTAAQLRINYFPGGDGFYGYRHGLELLTCLVPLYAYSWHRAGRTARRWTPLVVGLQVSAISLGACLDGFYVRLQDVWTDNGVLAGLRVAPALTIGWFVLGTALALKVAHDLRTAPVDAN